MPVRSNFCVVVSPLVITQKKPRGVKQLSSFDYAEKKGEKCKKEMNEHSTLPAEHLCWSDMKQSNDFFPLI